MDVRINVLDAYFRMDARILGGFEPSGRARAADRVLSLALVCGMEKRRE